MAVITQAPSATFRPGTRLGHPAAHASTWPTPGAVLALVVILVAGLSVSPWFVAALGLALAVRAGGSRWMVSLVAVSTLLLMVGLVFAVSPFHIGPVLAGQAVGF